MADLAHQNQTVGFLAEGATIGTEVITAGVPYYYFGYHTFTFDFPEIVQKFQELWAGDSYYPYEILLKSYQVLMGVIAVPSNAIMLYHILGGASTVAGVTTITPISLGKTETFNVRWNTGNGTDYIRDTALGLKLVQVIGSWDLSDKGLPWNETYSAIGEDMIESVVTTKVDPVHPDGATTDNQEEYVKDSNTVISWDGEDITSKVLLLTYFINTFNAVVNIDSQKKPKRVTNADIILLFELNMIRTDIQSLYTDFRAQKTAIVEKTLIITGYSTATHYRTITVSNCTITKVAINKAMIAQGDEPVYKVQIRGRAISIVSADGLAGSFYGQ